MKICLWHNWKDFSIGNFPLGARYCFRCGCLDVGNMLFYDGSVYQKRYRGKKAIEYVEKQLNYIKDYQKGIERSESVFGLGSYAVCREVLKKYESEEKYKEIIKQMKQVNGLVSK